MDSRDAPCLGVNMAGDDHGNPIHITLAARSPAHQCSLQLRLQAFLHLGCTKKEHAESLWHFCHTEKGPWILPDNDNDNNNAVPPPVSLRTPSSDMSASSSRSCSSHLTQPHTPTLEDNPSLAQNYGLNHLQQPQGDDTIKLRPFLLRLLAHHLKTMGTLEELQKIRDLYNRSTLPGHGTREGFDQLMVDADRSDAPNVASIDLPHAPSPVVRRLDGLSRPAFESFPEFSPPFLDAFGGSASRMHQKPKSPVVSAQVSPDPRTKAPEKDEKKGKEVSQNVVVQCKLLTRSGKLCSKVCSSEDAKNAEGYACKFLIEHIHRVHPDHYIANLPSNRKSLNDMFNVQIATCTLPLANGQPCAWRSATDKPWKAGIDHIREHHPQNFRPQLINVNKGSFQASKFPLHTLSGARLRATVSELVLSSKI